MMKKLFTSLLLLGVALSSWATIETSWDESTRTLKVKYTNTGDANELNNNLPNAAANCSAGNKNGQVLILKLEGDFTNDIFTANSKLNDLIMNAAGNSEIKNSEGGNTLYLDLSGCGELVSQYVYTGTKTAVDWTSSDFKYKFYKGGLVEKELVSKTVYKTENGVIPPSNAINGTTTYDWYNDGHTQGPHTLTEETIWGYYKGTTWDGQPDTNSEFVEVTAERYERDGKTYATVEPEYTALSFDNFNSKKYLNGISFPKNNDYFTAIPDDLFVNNTVLRSVDFGNKIQWIGANAFNGCTSLAYFNGNKTKGKVTFPQSICGIGIDAFYKCLEFVEVDLSNLPNLVRVDAAAFNMESTNNGNKLATVKLPESDNETLKFFANQVFSSTQVTDLDFSHCKGIYHFAYDGADYFDEGTYIGSTTSSTMTFAYHEKLQNIILPPNILLIAKNCFDKCGDLHSVTFTGSANYNSQCELPDNNRLEIDDNAFKDCTKLGGVIVKDDGTEDVGFVTLSNNLVRIGKRAFDQTALRSVSIPASVEVIEQMAFNENDDLTTVIFEDIDPNCQCGDDPTKKPSGYATVIKGGSIQYDEDGNPTTDPNNQEQGAFWNCKAITDVYINNQTQLQCENLAFVFDVTYGHADPSASLATLHFPEKDADHYANLEHYLTDAIAADPGKFHKWLHVHFHQAIQPKHNGWFEFVNAGPTKNNIDDPTNVCQDIILRTFSDWNYSYLVPEGIRAYVVNDVALDEATGNYELTLQRILAIPARTGVILYGHPNGKNTKGEPILSMTPIAFGKVGQTTVDESGKEITITEPQGLPLCRANWRTNYVKNFLEPTSTPSQADVDKLTQKWESETDATKKAALKAELDDLNSLIENNPAWKTQSGELKGGIYVKPYENLDNNQPYTITPAGGIAFRNFAMSRYNKTHNLSKTAEGKLKDGEVDYEGFFRMIAGYYPSGKAYLRLAATPDADGKIEYDAAEGAEILVKEDKGVNVSTDPEEEKWEGGYYYEYSKNDGSPYDARAEYAKEGHGSNKLGWWVEDHGFDWATVNPNYKYVDENSGKEITAPRMNWGTRPARFNEPGQAPRYLGELEENADGIVKLVIPANENTTDEYYTLQGVRVINPTKGVYIHNGKKMIIK